MWCYNQQSCLQRKQQTPFLVSSIGLEHTVEMDGLFDTDPRRSPFAGANKVYVAYCSSDAYAGDAGPESNPMGWSFRGQRIINATLRTLISQHGLGAMPGGKLIFSGCSAGSRGALFNLDAVPNMVPTGVEVLGFFDSPLWVDVEPMSATTLPLQNQTEMIYSLINPTARLDTDCVAAYADAPWKCLFGQYRLPFVKGRYLVSASQFDKYQLPYNEGRPPPYTGAGLAFADQFQQVVSSVVHSLPTAAQTGSAVFSSACFKCVQACMIHLYVPALTRPQHRHCTSDSGAFWGIKIGHVSLKDFMTAWLNGASKPQMIEDCVGFGCGQCHAKPPPGPPPPAPPAPLRPPLRSALAASSRVPLSPAKIGAAMLPALLICMCCLARRVKAPPRVSREDMMERQRLVAPPRTVAPTRGVVRSASEAMMQL